MTINVTRDTLETKIRLTLSTDTLTTEINTGVGFFDHMLTLFAFHAQLGLNVEVEGDTHIDDHHTVEDTGIVLGQALRQLTEDKRGLTRYGHAFVPMDESLSQVILDLSNRPFLVYEAQYNREQINGFATENVEEFCRALAMEARVTLHVKNLYGRNAHHQIESIFKALGQALKMALTKQGDRLPSTKGVL